MLHDAQALLSCRSNCTTRAHSEVTPCHAVVLGAGTRHSSPPLRLSTSAKIDDARPTPLSRIEKPTRNQHRPSSVREIWCLSRRRVNQQGSVYAQVR